MYISIKRFNSCKGFCKQKQNNSKIKRWPFIRWPNKHIAFLCFLSLTFWRKWKTWDLFYSIYAYVLRIVKFSVYVLSNELSIFISQLKLPVSSKYHCSRWRNYVTMWSGCSDTDYLCPFGYFFYDTYQWLNRTECKVNCILTSEQINEGSAIRFAVDFHL